MISSFHLTFRSAHIICRTFARKSSNSPKIPGVTAWRKTESSSIASIDGKGERASTDDSVSHIKPYTASSKICQHDDEHLSGDAVEIDDVSYEKIDGIDVSL